MIWILSSFLSCCPFFFFSSFLPHKTSSHPPFPLPSPSSLPLGEVLDLMKYEGSGAIWPANVRPVDVSFDLCGRLLVSDDAGLLYIYIYLYIYVLFIFGLLMYVLLMFLLIYVGDCWFLMMQVYIYIYIYIYKFLCSSLLFICIWCS